MTLRPSELIQVAAEIAAALAGRPVQRITQTDPRSLVIHFPSAWLYASIDPRRGRIHLLDHKPAGTGEEAPAFCMLLRKELIGARLISVDAVIGERALALRFSRRRAGEEPTARGLLFLLYGAGAHVVLVGEGDLPRGRLGGQRGDPKIPVVLPPPRDDDRPARFSALGVSAAIAAHYDEGDATSSVEAERAAALAAARKERARLARLEAALSSDLDRITVAADLRSHADLLLAHLAEIPRGASTVTLADDFHDGAPVTIALDPARSAQQNAARLYHTHKRLARGRATVEARLAETRASITRLDQRLLAITDADAPALAALTVATPPAGGAASSKRPPTIGGRGAARARSVPYRRFRSASGADILVGKGAERNDDLTFRVARGNDLWLHTRDLPGAHVVVPLAGRPVDEATLIDAATLAVWHSPARPPSALDDAALTQVQVDVTYLQRKLVKKPRNAAPGRVSVAGGKTLRVRLDPTRLRRLLASRVDDE